jgi:dipeptidyl-peptidase-4
MGLPREHRADYERTAVLPAAHNLQAHLLVLQGSSDDNVHLANSIALLEACIRAGKQVDYFVFPGARHGPRGTASMRYLYTKMLDWWQRTLT